MRAAPLWEQERFAKGTRILGLGLCIAFRKLYPQTLTHTHIWDYGQIYLNSGLHLAGIAILILLNIIGHRQPTSRWAFIAGVTGTLGMFTAYLGGNLGALGLALNALSFSVIIIVFGIMICCSSEDDLLLTLASALLISMIFVCLVQLIPQSAGFIVLACLPLAIGLAFSRQREYPIDSTLRSWAAELSHIEEPSRAAERHARTTGVVSLAALLIASILCSILNGLAYDHFSVNSSTSLAAYLFSGILTIIMLVFYRRRNQESPLARYWPLFFLLLVIGLASFSGVLPINPTISLAIGFAAVTFFSVGSWILFPFLIKQHGLPIIPAFGLVSIISYGTLWRHLGIHLRTQELSLLSINAFGSITILIVLVFLVVWMYRHMRRLTDSLKKAAAQAQADSPSRSGGTEAGGLSSSDDQSALLAALVTSCGISEREAEVLSYLVKGFSAFRIAEKLFVSESTVRFHIKNLYRKCSVSSKQELLDKLTKIEE